MAKTINIKSNEGKEYTLEYTRRTVKAMLENDFNINDLKGAKAVLALPELFEGAFMAHHPKALKTEVRELYKTLPNKEKLAEVLIGMFSEPLNAMYDEITEDPEEGSGNATWEVSE